MVAVMLACRKLAALRDTVSEWLRRWTRNPLGFARRGSNPLGVAFALVMPELHFEKDTCRKSFRIPNFLSSGISKFVEVR